MSNGPRKQTPTFNRPHEPARPEPAEFSSRQSLLFRKQQRVRHRIRRRPIF